MRFCRRTRYRRRRDGCGFDSPSEPRLIRESYSDPVSSLDWSRSHIAVTHSFHRWPWVL